MCRNYKSGNRCIHGNNCLSRHADGEEKPSKRSKSQSTQGAVAILKEQKFQGFASQNSRSKEVYSAKSWANEIERFGGTHYKILRTHLVRSSNSGKNWAISRRRSLRKEHPRKPHDKKSTPAKQHGIRRYRYIYIYIYKLKAEEKATFYSILKIRSPVPVSKNTEERMFVVDSGASMHMLSKKDLSSDEMDTLRRSRNPTTVVTANGEVQTNEKAQVYVHDLDLFVTVQLLEETPAVLSLGELCPEHGCSYDWKKL